MPKKQTKKSATNGKAAAKVGSTVHKKTEKQIAESKSLVKNALSPKQVLFVLQKTPREHVYKRPAKGGGEWEYVTGTYVKKVLNYAFGWMWDFEVKNHGREDNLVWVLGRLTVKNPKGEVMIVKEQFGRADIKFKRGSKEALDYGNDLKAATTDALKKCAAELGIASDVYGKMEFKEIHDEYQPKTPPKRNDPPEIEAECTECANPISKAEETYSKKLYGRALCRECQKLANQGLLKNIKKQDA